MDVNKWINALIEPVETFRNEKKNANLEKAVINVGSSGAIVGVIQGIIILLFGAMVGIPPDFRVTAMIVATVIMMIMTPISAIISLLIASGIWFVIARLLGGKGNYVEQTHLYSLIYAPVIVIIAVLWTPIFITGFFHRGFPLLEVLVLVHLCVLPLGLYLLTMALKEVHGYSTIKAVLTWSIPVIILLVGGYYILLRLYDDPYY